MQALVLLCDSQDPEVLEHSVFALSNLAVHDANKTLLMGAGGVEALVRLHGHDVPKIRSNSARALAVLADTATGAELETQQVEESMDALVELLRTDNALVQVSASNTSTNV